MVHVFVFHVDFTDSDRCQFLHGAAKWCLLLPRTVESSIDMLYGRFRIDLYALSCVGEIDVVVWQWEVNWSYWERCQAHCCLVVSFKSLSSNINCTPTPRAVLAPLFLGPLIRGQGLST